MSALVVALSVLALLLLAFSISMAVNVSRLRTAKRQQGLSAPWRIPRKQPEELDPVFAPGPYGPTLDTEVHFVGGGGANVRGGTTDVEAWVLAVLAKRATTLFEFGTCTGKTTYLWARNSPPHARVTTLTLAPDEHGAYVAGADDDPRATGWALQESQFTRFLYTGTDVERKVTQLYGDSKAFDETPFVDSCDLIFVDGSHAYSYVVSDSRKALRMVRPGGIVLWHDYGGPAWAADVYRALNELSEKIPLLHIAGTKLVAYRRPQTDGRGSTQNIDGESGRA